jgi:hypothetical protein
MYLFNQSVGTMHANGRADERGLLGNDNRRTISKGAYEVGYVSVQSCRFGPWFGGQSFQYYLFLHYETRKIIIITTIKPSLSEAKLY